MSDTGKRPEAGELEPGQPVMVRRDRNDMRGRPPEERYIPAVVVKAARVWIDLEGMDGSWRRTWRMRRDTQTEGSQYTGSDASFATLEQHAWDEAAHRAANVLRDHGLTVERTSPWRGREIQLADLLAKMAPQSGAEEK